MDFKAKRQPTRIVIPWLFNIEKYGVKETIQNWAIILDIILIIIFAAIGLNYIFNTSNTSLFMPAWVESMLGGTFGCIIILFFILVFKWLSRRKRRRME